MGTVRVWVLVLCGPVLATACDDDGGAAPQDDAGADTGDGGGDAGTDAGGDTDSADSSPDFEIGEFAWEPCVLVDGGLDEPAGECATIDVPLDWSQPEGGTLELFLRRSPAPGPVAGQIWIVPGGPGFSGATGGSLIRAVGERHPAYDVLVLDHRGVGGSTRLTCSEQEQPQSPAGTDIAAEEWPDCLAAVDAEWGDGLAHFSVSQAARDYHALIEATRPTTGDVVLWGVSYGGYLVLRFLQLFPDQITAVVLDSPAVPGARLDDFALQFDAVGEALFDLCAEDDFCGTRLGPDPWAVAQATVADFETGCPDLDADPLMLRRVLGALAEQPHPWEGTAPSFIYRLRRCEEADVAALERALFVLTQGASPPPEIYAPVLASNIVFSEMWRNLEATVEDRIEEELALTMSHGLATYLTPAARDWPVYTDPLADGWPETDIPMLIVVGPLDPRTPIAGARQAADHFSGPQQRLIELANARHTATSTTLTEDGQLCGSLLVAQFIDHPGDELDTSCLDELAGPEFAGDAEVADLIYGTSNLWENE